MKKLLIAWAVLFVAWMAGSYVVHHLLLGADYKSVASLFRTPEQAQGLFHWMILAHVLMAGAFAWIYSRGVEAKPWLGQGLRFGLAVALMGVVPMYLIYYVVQPMPALLVAKQIAFDGVLVLVLGALAALLLRRDA
jgi:hypothetical protein